LSILLYLGIYASPVRADGVTCIDCKHGGGDSSSSDSSSSGDSSGDSSSGDSSSGDYSGDSSSSDYYDPYVDSLQEWHSTAVAPTPATATKYVRADGPGTIFRGQPTPHDQQVMKRDLKTDFARLAHGTQLFGQGVPNPLRPLDSPTAPRPQVPDSSSPQAQAHHYTALKLAAEGAALSAAQPNWRARGSMGMVTTIVSTTAGKMETLLTIENVAGPEVFGDGFPDNDTEVADPKDHSIWGVFRYALSLWGDK
jgi:hypothetical protein